MKLILTCEHGGNDIPDKYHTYFKNEKAILNSHQGYDLGALNLFKHIKQLADDSYFSKTSRLLIELNRSLHHPNLFSKNIKYLPRNTKDNIINIFYLPYRNAIESKIKSYIKNNESVIHISIHSFTPMFKNTERHCDIGLLYDSTNKEEKQFCMDLKNILKKLDSNLNIRYNYPYLGKADGFTTYLRKKFPKNYLGIELEINQKFSNKNLMDIHLKNTILNALKVQIPSIR